MAGFVDVDQYRSIRKMVNKPRFDCPLRVWVYYGRYLSNGENGKAIDGFVYPPVRCVADLI